MEYFWGILTTMTWSVVHPLLFSVHPLLLYNYTLGPGVVLDSKISATDPAGIGRVLPALRELTAENNNISVSSKGLSQTLSSWYRNGEMVGPVVFHYKPIRHLSFRDPSDLNTRLLRPGLVESTCRVHMRSESGHGYCRCMKFYR